MDHVYMHVLETNNFFSLIFPFTCIFFKPYSKFFSCILKMFMCMLMKFLKIITIIFL